MRSEQAGFPVATGVLHYAITIHQLGKPSVRELAKLNESVNDNQAATAIVPESVALRDAATP